MARRLDYTYTYTGEDFIDSTMSVTGWFTVASPLGANLPTSNIITPTAFSFTDGEDTIANNLNDASTLFTIGTDASGNIENWNISVNGIDGSWGTITGGPGNGPWPSGESGFDNWEDYAPGLPTRFEFAEIAGTWQSPSSVPEPSSLMLLGTGALGLIGAIRRKLRA
jgi:hypothetical protein